uniref:Uncharacterized protein n=1 Tax=Amphora coffeiformis TaxID=265554 RepID=A0A7S3L6B7_9STRA
MMPDHPLKDTWKIFYDDQLVHTFSREAMHRVAERSTYFESLLSRWGDDGGGDNDGNKSHDATHHIMSLQSVGPLAVTMVLQALDDSLPLSSEIVEAIEATRHTGIHLPEQLVHISFYLGCDNLILPWYCTAAKPRDKTRVAYYLCTHGQPHEFQTILSTPHFFDGFDKQTLSLLRDFCVSLSVAVLLLGAHKKAPEQGLLGFTGGLLGSVKRIWASEESYLPSSLSVDEFALLTVQKFVQEEWSIEDMNLVFPVLSPTRMGYSKPRGLETFLITAIRMHMDIPSVLRNWNINVTQIGPVLFEMGRLDEAPEWPDPGLLMRSVTDNWTPEDCLVALRENKGGIWRLFVVLTDPETFAWLLTIPIFHETCCIAPEGNVQFLLYRHLFWHMGFDPRLPPSLLSKLPFRENCRCREKVLENAVRYLEHGNETGVEAVDLPWEYASREQTERAAVALRNEDSKIWRQLNISHLRGGRFLELVPAKVLALFSFEEGFRGREEMRHQKARISELQNKVEDLERIIRQLERRVSQSFDHQSH